MVNIFATFENGLNKMADSREIMVIFNARSWKTRKIMKFRDYGKTRNLCWVLSKMLRPTFVPNWMARYWHMSPGMRKSISSSNDPYSVRLNLHNRTRQSPLGNERPCQVWKWSVKNYGCMSANGPAAYEPLEQKRYPGALKCCGIKTRVQSRSSR